MLYDALPAPKSRLISAQFCVELASIHLRKTEPKLKQIYGSNQRLPGGGGSKPSKHGFPFGQPCWPRESIGPNLKPKLRTYAAGGMKVDIRCAELGFRPIHFTRNLGAIRFTAQSVSLGSALRGTRFGHHHREPQLKQTQHQTRSPKDMQHMF